MSGILHARREDAPQRGAVAVEAALVLSFFVIPLLLGVLAWGEYFWRAQKIDTHAPRIPAGMLLGTFSCAGLVSEVQTTVAGIVTDLDPSSPVSPSDVAVEVVEQLPDVGVVVRISVRSSVVSSVTSLIPLPDGGSVVTDFTQRLDDVVISPTEVCR